MVIFRSTADKTQSPTHHDKTSSRAVLVAMRAVYRKASWSDNRQTNNPSAVPRPAGQRLEVAVGDGQDRGNHQPRVEVAGPRAQLDAVARPAHYQPVGTGDTCHA